MVCAADEEAEALLMLCVGYERIIGVAKEEFIDFNEKTNVYS